MGRSSIAESAQEEICVALAGENRVERADNGGPLMNNISLPVTGYSFLRSVAIILAILSLLAGCVSPPSHPDWIRVGATTKHDVIERYGPPDMVIASPDGETAVYRPTASVPRLEIPTAQVGPSGTAVTSMRRIDPGLGANDLNRERAELLRSEIRIRYDSRGIVQELTSP